MQNVSIYRGYANFSNTKAFLLRPWFLQQRFLSLLARYPDSTSKPLGGFGLALLSIPRSRHRPSIWSYNTFSSRSRDLPSNFLAPTVVIFHVWDSASSRLLADFHRSAHIASVVPKKRKSEYTDLRFYGI